MSSPVEPMLAIASTGASGWRPIDVRKLVERGDWVLDEKLDGCRAIVYDGRIYSRRGTDITHKFPEALGGASYPYVLDGEIVAEDGTFDTLLMRESQDDRGKIGRLADSKPCRFVAFDIPFGVTGYFTGTWEQRRELLGDHPSLRVTAIGHDTTFLDNVEAKGGEGVIAKRRASRYQPGKRSADWVKKKFTFRTTCIAYGYEPGNGSRAHFGALKLALITEAGEVIDVGRTGSGFTDRQTWELKSRLDTGEMFPAEIEHMKTENGSLRFPVFRGVRHDKTLLDCGIDQLGES